MASEAQSRDQSFRDQLSVPGTVFDVLKYEYLMRTKLWRNAMVGGLQWTGIPGLRGVGLGTGRKLDIGGGSFNKLGINLINKPVQRGLDYFGIKYDFVKYGIGGNIQNRINDKFASGTNQNIFGKILGGTTTNLLKIEEATANQKFLEKNWIRALFSSKVAGERFPGAQTPTMVDAIKNFRSGQPITPVGTIYHKLGTRSTAWKFAATQKLMPGAIWGANLAFVASLTAPLFSMAGQFVSGRFEEINRLARVFDNKSLEFGGRIHSSYMNGAGVTERQRALMELQRSRTNSRTFIGSEAGMYHV